MNSPLRTPASSIMTYYQQAYEKFQANLGKVEPIFLSNLRNESIKKFTTLGFPTSREEDWKYTSLAACEKQFFNPISDFSHPPSSLFEKMNDDVYLIIFRDGEMLSDINSIVDQEKNIVIKPILEFCYQEPELAALYLKDSFTHDEPLRCLNNAFFKSGLYIFIKENTKLSKPLHLKFINTDTGASFVPLRNLIFIQQNAQATLIEDYSTIRQSACFTLPQTDLFLAKNARVTHAKFINEENKGIHIGKLSVGQHENSYLLSQSLVIGGALVRSDTDTRLIEKNSTCELNGLYLAHEKNHIDHHTKIHHQGTSTQSKQYYKGVISGYGHAVFNGKILIDPLASKTDAQQMNKNLLLTDTGEIDTKPQLEIYTDDVKCTHGATVGKLDENALFYILSRGLSLNNARRLLLLAFIQELFDKMPEFSRLLKLPLFLEKFLAYD